MRDLREGDVMATGAEHYREAERLLLDCERMPADERNPAVYPAIEDGVNSVGNALAAAQVHATLALAAATGLNEAVAGMPERDRDDWQKTAGHPLPGKDGDL